MNNGNNDNNKICRICFQSDTSLINTDCKCKDKMIHYKCACRWFGNRINVVLSGKLKSVMLNVNFDCVCEVCLSPINQILINRIGYHYSNKLLVN